MSIHQEDITIVNIYTSNIRPPKYFKQIIPVLKREINGKTLITGEFSTALSTMDKSSRQKINKKSLDLKYMLDQMDQTHTYRTFHPMATEYTFF